MRCNQFAKKRPEKWRDGEWILHHNNTPAHTSHLMQHFLAKHGTAQWQQPPYSPDLAPCDFFLFPRLKKVLKGHRFETTEDIKRNSTKTLLDITKKGVRKMFPKVAERFGEVCSCGRELCWRQLGLKPRKLYLLHVLWSVRILFEQTSYAKIYIHDSYRKKSNKAQQVSNFIIPYLNEAQHVSGATHRPSSGA